MFKTKKNYRNETIFFVLMALICFMLFCFGKKNVLADDYLDEEVHINLWTLGTINSDGTAELTSYDAYKETNVVIPNVVDFKNAGATEYASLKKVYIGNNLMVNCANKANEIGGVLRISRSSNGEDDDEEKVFSNYRGNLSGGQKALFQDQDYSNIKLMDLSCWKIDNCAYMYGMYGGVHGSGDLYLDGLDATGLSSVYASLGGNQYNSYFHEEYPQPGMFENSHNILYISLSSLNLDRFKAERGTYDQNGTSYERNAGQYYSIDDNIFAINDEEGREEPLLITTNDDYLTELTTLRNNCQNRTLFETTLKVDGEKIRFKGNEEDAEDEFANYSDDQTEKYINLYTSFTTPDSREEILQKLETRLEEEKDNLNVGKGIKVAGFMPEGDYEGKVSYSLQGNYVAVTWPTLKEKIYVGTSKILDNIPELPDGCKLLYKTEDSDWIEYIDGELIKFDKSGDYKIYLRMTDASGNFELEYTDDHDKDYMDLKVLEKEKNDEEENEQKENDSYGWSTIENSGGSPGGGSSSSSTNKDLISNNQITNIETLLPTGSKIPEKLRTRKYLFGYSDGTMKPENCVTNAEFATIIYRLMNNGETINYDKLKNIGIEKSDWFADAVAYLIDDSRKMISVTGEKFEPNKNIKVYEMLNIIHNVLKFYGADKSLTDNQDLNSYVTRAKMSEIIFKAFERKSNPGQKTYSDLNDRHWAYKYLMDTSE